VRDMLGTRVPRKPQVMSTGVRRPDMPIDPGSTGGRSYGRPGEPVNKVFVQYSNDLEGFLPYTLVISEEHGLEFFSLSGHPDFLIEPLNVLVSTVVDYDTVMQDSFFSNLARNIMDRSDLRSQELEESASSKVSQARAQMYEERIQPPYKPMVQLSIRRTAFEGGQVLVFIAVQTDVLAMELVRGIKQLRRRRAVLQSAIGGGGGSGKGSGGEGGGTGGTADGAEDVTTRSFSAPSRGCPTPRTVASQSLASSARTGRTGM